jgi:NAD-dependent dihydropyrimidine dehydrogenase PreA subunit
MRRLRDCFLDALQTCLRVLPWPTEPRLIRVGEPGPEDPVLLTCNYALTVRRVLRALRGIDAYVLVAPTRGINVWCSAAGGYFTAHQVIASIRTTGIGALVNHRRLILPQLAATGVERKLVEERVGWHVVFGPVYACDLPSFLESGRKSPAMRQVRFPLRDRLEMAVSWAFPSSLVGGAILVAGWRDLLLPFVLMVWILALGLFTLFPWLPGRVERASRRSPGWTRYLVFFDPAAQRNLLVWLLFVCCLWGFAFVARDFDYGKLAGWSIASLLVVLVFSMDMAGSTPLYKSGLHEDRMLHVALDEVACRGRAMCWEVCPKNCYVIDTSRHKAVVALPDACVQCGACVVQCPEDALAFTTASNQRIPPETIRRYKLNLLGRRAIPVSREEARGTGRSA